MATAKLCANRPGALLSESPGLLDTCTHAPAPYIPLRNRTWVCSSWDREAKAKPKPTGSLETDSQPCAPLGSRPLFHTGRDLFGGSELGVNWLKKGMYVRQWRKGAAFTQSSLGAPVVVAKTQRCTGWIWVPILGVACFDDIVVGDAWVWFFEDNLCRLAKNGTQKKTSVLQVSLYFKHMGVDQMVLYMG